MLFAATRRKGFEEVSGESPDTAREARALPRRCDDAFREFRQFVPLNGALSFLTAQMRLREQLAQIFVTGAILHQHRQNRSILHAQFAAHNGPDILLPGGDRKSLRAVDAVAIEQRHRRHLELGRGFS